MTSKTCTKCGENKLIKHFTRRPDTRKDGTIAYHSWCLKCKRTIISKTRKYDKKEPKPRVCVVCGTIYYSNVFKKKTCDTECGDALKRKNWREWFKTHPKQPKTKKVAKKDNSLAKWTKRGKIHYAGIRDI